MDRGAPWVQDQQHRYFHIDRKFGSGSLQDINDALDDLEIFLASITKMDLANSLIVRLTELIPSTKSLLLKHRAADIFAHNVSLILKLPSRDEIAASLIRFIKAGDQATRVVCLQMMSNLTGPWIKDIGYYHILLGKLCKTNSLSMLQKKQAIICLRKLLASCPNFSKTFSKNILQLIDIYQIPLRILLYLLSFAMIDSHHQKQLLQYVLALMTVPDYQMSKREAGYFQRVVLRFARVNYRIIEFYEKSNLCKYFPRLKASVQKIKHKKYQFLRKQFTVNDEKQWQNVQSLIDQLYIKKKEGKLQDQYQNYQDIIYSFIDTNITSKENMQIIILLLYFIEDNATHYDRILRRYIVNQHVHPTFAFFKKLAVVGCFESALFILSKLQIDEPKYLFLRAYLQFKAQKEPKKIDDLREIAEAISPELHIVIQAWQIMEDIVRLSLSSTWQQIAELQRQLRASISTLSKDWEQLVKVCLIFGQMKEGQSCIELKQRCYAFLPSSLMSASSYWYAHFTKQTINTILKLTL